MNKLIKKCQNPSGPIEYVGMPQNEWDWITYMQMADPNNPKYKWFLQYAKDKYGRQGDTRLPEVVIEAKRPEKTLAENAKENVKEVKQKWSNLPIDSKVDLALTGAGFIPGLDVVADVADIGREAWKGNWGNVALGVGLAAIPGLSLAGYKTYLAAKDANKTRKVAKELEHAINKRIWRDGRNIEKYGYNPRRIIMGTPVGMPEPDVNTFFHSGNFVSNLQPGTPVPKRGGYVRVKDGQIQPIDGGSGEPRIWWNKGDNYGKDEIILTTKSSKVDDQVISSPEKYKDSDIMHYSPNYYTSGAIPLDEVDVYYRNPLTGDYDHPIQHTPTTPKIEGNTYLGMLERPSTLSDAELKGVTKHDRNRVIRTNPLAGVDSNVNTYLINRSNTPIEFVNGTSVWFPGGSRAGKERATVHFTTDRPVIGHAYGDWSTSSETLLTPYTQVVKDNGLPLNIEPMDTYFSQLYPFIIRQDGTKIFTSNPHNYRRYKARGVDVYTDKEAQQLWQQMRDLQIEENLLKDKLGNEMFIPGTKAWDEAYDLRRRMDQVADRHDDIHVNWTKQQNTVDLDTYRQMESETGLRSGVTTRRREWYDHTDTPPVLEYSTTPPTHSASWFMDRNSPQQRYDMFLQYLKEYPDIITDQDVQMFQRLLQTNPDLMKQYLQHIRFKYGGRLIPKHSKGNKVEETFGIDTSKFTKNPSNTRQDSKKVTNPNEQRNKLTKKKHASYINPQFVNARPTPGFITVPRKNIVNK